MFDDDGTAEDKMSNALGTLFIGGCLGLIAIVAVVAWVVWVSVR